MEEAPCCGVCAYTAHEAAHESPPERDEGWSGPVQIRCGAQATTLSPERPQITIGRGRSVDLRLQDSKISRHQCSLEWRGGEVWVIDERSACGTLVRGALISEARVVPGDQIWVGDSVLVIEPA